MFAGLLYGLHPALIEGVAFVSSRFDLLMTAFLLLALLAELRLKGRRRLLGVGLAFLLAALSKEMALAFALALPFWRLSRTVTDSVPTPAAPTRKERFQSLAVRLDLPLHAAVLLGGLAYLGVRYLSLGYLVLPSPSAIQSGNLLQHALLVVKSLGEYLRLVLWPYGSLSPIHFSQLPVSTGEAAAWSMLLVLGLLVYGLVVLLRSKNISARRAGWLALAGAAALLPVANLLPLELGGSSFIAERFLLFPTALFVLALVAGLQPLLEGERLTPVAVPTPETDRQPVSASPSRYRGWAYAGLGAWLVACLVTVQLTLPHWRDDLSLWTWAWRAEPRSATPPTNLSLEFTDIGQPQRGLVLAQQALQLDPQSPNTWNNLGLALFHLGQFAEAQEAFERAVELQPESALYWSNLAGALREQDQLQEAEKLLLDQALRLSPDLPSAHLNLGLVYLKADRPDLAAQHLQAAAQLLPPGQSQEAQSLLQQTQDPARWLRLGGLLLENGEAQAAAQAFDTASRLGAPLVEAAYGLSAALIELEDWQSARSVLETALQQAPADARLYNNLGIVLQEQSELELARQMFEKAIQLAPEWEEPANQLLELGEE